MSPIQAVLTDIEGTTTPIAFVHDVLFPYARAQLPAFLAQSAARPDVVAELAAVARLAPGQPALSALLGWMDQDAKITPLKAIQGLLWRDGYESGALHGAVYADVPPHLRAWAARGLALMVYSSGSVEAQHLLFRHSDAGDLTGLFRAYFDTRTGPKREAGSYAAIAATAGMAPGSILFLSDIGAELDAARAAGCRTCQIIRPGDGTAGAGGHPQAVDFGDAARLCGLPSLEATSAGETFSCENPVAANR